MTEFATFSYIALPSLMVLAALCFWAIERFGRSK